MHPAHDGLFLTANLPCPFAGIAVLAGDHGQRLKAFSAASMRRLQCQALDIGQRLLPFAQVWFDHVSLLSCKSLSRSIPCQTVYMIHPKKLLFSTCFYFRCTPKRYATG